MTFDDIVGTKARKADQPYCVFAGGGFTFKVLKRYGKTEKDFARIFLAASSPFTFGSDDLGDGYVRDTVLHAKLVEVDGHPPTIEEQLAVAALVDILRARQDPMAAMGF